jgi:hypothetical protein
MNDETCLECDYGKGLDIETNECNFDCNLYIAGCLKCYRYLDISNSDDNF